MLDAPKNVNNQPSVEDEYTSRYFEFYTNETGETEFTGTSVYYKIYNSKTTLNSETSSLNAIANNTEDSYNAPTRLMDTYKYRSLKASGLDDPLISYSKKNKKVYIRLSDYLGQDDYSAQIKIDDKILFTENGNKSIPLRNISSTATFNFGGSKNNDKIPASDDDDVKYSSGGGEDGVWYVAMFAVAVGHETTYNPIYSNILYLGAVKIEYSDQRS